jgi:hypothetical protein
VTLAKESIRSRGRCLVALSGGSTPRPLYGLLATPPYATRLDWPQIHLFWGDERIVPGTAAVGETHRGRGRDASLGDGRARREAARHVADDADDGRLECRRGRDISRGWP